MIIKRRGSIVSDGASDMRPKLFVIAYITKSITPLSGCKAGRRAPLILFKRKKY